MSLSLPRPMKSASSVMSAHARFGDSIGLIEGEWEPPAEENGLHSLDNLKDTISKLEEEWRSKDHYISGRILLACHTLPYQCVLDAVETLHVSENLPPVEIQPGDLIVNPKALHSPSATSHKPLPNLGGHETPLTPDDKRQESTFQGGEGEMLYRWILRPRRGHAALNAGIRSLADRDVTLVAWPGEMEDANGDSLTCDELTEVQQEDLAQGLRNLVKPGAGGIRCVPVWLKDSLASNFYEGYCKTYLWPLFHYFALSDHIDKDGEKTAWDAYYEANKQVAKALADQYQQGDIVCLALKEVTLYPLTIWIHDYHLTLVPRFLRQWLPDALIGFFLHSPFPSSEFFRCLPRRETILDGMLGANLCCFQTYSYGRHFLSSCVRVMGYEGVRAGVDARGQVTHIGYCPIGIDADRIEADRKEPGVQPKIEALRELYRGKKIVIGRDKLDPTKGVLPKLQAFDRFLNEYPEWVGRVVLIQVTSPSQHDSAVLATKVSEIVDSINGTFGSLSYQPVHHYHQAIDQDEYFALLSVADLALIHSIRDGMNTTSMEFTLCQTEHKNPIILSEYCGTTNSMKAAIRINPWDLGDCARAIDRCLRMSPREKAERHAQLYQRVRTHTAAVWARELVLKLLQCIGTDPASEQTPDLDTDLVKERYDAAPRRLMLFDYDGTLTPIVKDPSAALPSKKLLRALSSACKDERNVVYIISGRDSAFLEEHLGEIKSLGFSAEHGCFLKEPNSETWEDLTKHMDTSWRQDVEEIFKCLQDYEERTTGAFLEKKQSAVTFHYRNADPLYGEFQDSAKECQALLEMMEQKLPIDVIVGKKNLEVRPAFTNKGEIVQRLLYQHHDAEFLLCVGDDRTDEDMFRAIHDVQTLFDSADSPTLEAPASLSVMSTHSATSANTSPRMPSPAASIESAISGLSLPSNSPPRERHTRQREPTTTDQLPSVVSALSKDSVFSVVVDENKGRKTIASWQAREPQEVIDLLAKLAHA